MNLLKEIYGIPGGSEHTAVVIELPPGIGIVWRELLILFLVALGARYLSHILSGYLLFSGWADWFFTQDGFPAWGAKLVESLSPTALGWVYSIVYNGFYMVPELILTAIAAQLIARIPKIVVKVD